MVIAPIGPTPSKQTSPHSNLVLTTSGTLTLLDGLIILPSLNKVLNGSTRSDDPTRSSTSIAGSVAGEVWGGDWWGWFVGGIGITRGVLCGVLLV